MLRLQLVENGLQNHVCQLCSLLRNTGNRPSDRTLMEPGRNAVKASRAFQISSQDQEGLVARWDAKPSVYHVVAAAAQQRVPACPSTEH